MRELKDFTKWKTKKEQKKLKLVLKLLKKEDRNKRQTKEAMHQITWN